MLICPHCGAENSPLAGEKLTHCLACGKPLYIPEMMVEPPGGPGGPGEPCGSSWLPEAAVPCGPDSGAHGLSLFGGITFCISAVTLFVGTIGISDYEGIEQLGGYIQAATGFLGCLLSLILIGIGMVCNRLRKP